MIVKSIIGDNSWNNIWNSHSDGIITVPGVDWETLWKTPLGGEVMIHGASADRTGTAGCVGLDDKDIVELYEAVPLGTTVVVKP